MASLLDTLTQQLSPEVVRGMGKQIGADEKQTEQALSALLPMMVGGLAKNTASNPEGSMKLSQALERDHDGSMLEHITGMLGGADAKNHPLAGVVSGGQGGDLLSGLLGGAQGNQVGNLLGAVLGSGGTASVLGGLMGGGGAQKGGGADLLTGLLGGGNSNTANMLGGLLGTAPTSSRASNVAGILGNMLGGGNVPQIQQGVSKATGLDAGKVGALMGMLAPMVMGALGKVKRQQGLDAGGLAKVLDNDRQAIEKNVPEASNISKFLDSNRDGKVDLKDDVAKVGMALGGAMLLSKMRKK
ncbi:MAG: DUF937 domain-containing protein [Trueperaceae bacterium]